MKTKVCLMLVWMLCVLPLAGSAQETEQNDQLMDLLGSEQGEEEVSESVSETVEEITQEKSGNLSFDFKEADLKNVLRLFSYKTGINIIIGADVGGTVTMRLMDVPWEKALRLILDVNGFTYVQDDNIIKIIPKTEMENEPLVNEVLMLNYAKATDVAKTIDPMINKERGFIKVDERTNTILIADIPTTVMNVKKIVSRLDSPIPQVLIEAHLVETRFDAGEYLGIKWSSLGEDGVKFSLKNVSKEYVDTVMRVKTAKNETLNTDKVGPSASVDKATVQTKTTDGETGKVTYSDRVEDVSRYTTLSDTVDRNVSRTVSAGKVSAATLSMTDFEAVIHALEEDASNEFLASPRIVVTNNQQAKILVGEQYPLANFVFNDETGTLEVQGFDYKDIGIQLDVKANVSPNENVILDVHPQVSEKGALIAFAGATGTDIPIIITEEVITQVVVRNNETLVIGGLLRSKKENSGSKVPLLGDIPFAGRLFKHKSNTSTKRNLLIFITPTIITDVVAARKLGEYQKELALK